MPNQNQEINNMNNNYTLTKILQVGTNPISAMIGFGSYYGRYLNNPILGTINSLLFTNKLGIDILNLNQRPNFKTRLLNSSKKILLGLGTISIVNYAKFINEIIEPVIPTTTSVPFTTTTPIPFTTTTNLPNITTTPTTTTEWNLLLNENNNINNNLINWNTYISLNTFGVVNIISGIIEAFANNQGRLKKVCDIASGSSLISAGIDMGMNNDFNNSFAIPTVIAGASEIINTLLPLETTNISTEMQETTFTIDENESLLNQANTAINYGSRNSIDSLTSDVLYDRQQTNQATVMTIN